MGVEVRMGIAFVSISIETQTPRLIILFLHVLMVHLILCDAQGSGSGSGTTRSLRGSVHSLAKFHSETERLNQGDLTFQSFNTQPLLGVGSPFTLPPYDSLPPVPLPDSSPPYCTNPPSTPQTPITIPSPGYGTSPPPPPLTYGIPAPVTPMLAPPNPIGIIPAGPPSDQYSVSPTPPQIVPGPTIPGPGIGIGSTPTSPAISSSPPAPVAILPSPSTPNYYYPITPAPGRPPAFLPPVIFPAPAVPPPPNTGTSIALWCVAKPSVPDPIIQEAMNYACGSGADCASIQPQGLCFEPNTLFAHASYAFNSYWQRTKVAGGTCSFGGTAILVTVDPSYDGCHFVYY